MRNLKFKNSKKGNRSSKLAQEEPLVSGTAIVENKPRVWGKLEKLQNAGEKGNSVKKNNNTSVCRAGRGNATEENDEEIQTEIHNQRKILRKKTPGNVEFLLQSSRKLPPACRAYAHHLKRNKYQITLEFLSCRETHWKTIEHVTSCVISRVRETHRAKN